jgi:3D (Asp-Asp-Asp) domain-containing protein
VVSRHLVRVISAVTVVASTPACRGEPPIHDAAPRAPAGAPRGSFALTYYWLENQPKGDPDDLTLFTRACEPVVSVSSEFARDLTLAGTARLLDGRVLGVAGDCDCKRSPCVRVLPGDQPWGVGLDNRPLAPFVSLAVDRAVIPIGTALYIEELDGAPLPGVLLALHDGCVVADDTGGRMKGAKIDWFVGRREAYALLDAQLHLTQVTVHDGGERCR